MNTYNSLGMSKAEIKTILILNVALTIPARIAIGILVDKFGSKRTYSALLAFGSGALIVLIAVQFIEEPKGHMAEVQEDGSVEMIHVG